MVGLEGVLVLLSKSFDAPRPSPSPPKSRFRVHAASSSRQARVWLHLLCCLLKHLPTCCLSVMHVRMHPHMHTLTQ